MNSSCLVRSRMVAFGIGLMIVSVGSLPARAQSSAVRHSQKCFIATTPQVEVAVTAIGGMMAPVTFFRDSDSPIKPYYVSPWQDEPASEMPVPVLVALRGDFFCMPFGGNSDAVNGEKHPPHGEVAGSEWRLVGTQKTDQVTTLTMAIDTTVRKGTVTKQLSLVDGQNVIYTTHTIDGFVGRAPLGHHATLAMPDREGSVRIATSPIRFGKTCPGLFSDPKLREYQALLSDASWPSLSKVPKAGKGEPDADLSRLPGRVGFADLIQVYSQAPKNAREPAWVTATFAEEGYLWFSLKDSTVLNSTVFWMENHGRHGHPWNGRNNCLGLEDVTAYFADGLAASTSDNVLTKAGIATAVELKADAPTKVRYIQGVVRIPAGFDVVKSAQFGAGEVTFVSAAGVTANTRVNYEFLFSGKL